METIKQIWFLTLSIFKIHPVAFSWALLAGLGWRFTLILGYVFSLHAVGLAFGATPSIDLPFETLLPADKILWIVGSIIFLLFFVSAMLDILYTKARLAIEMAIELHLTRKLDIVDSYGFSEVTYKKKSYCSQVLLRCFDIIYSTCLIVISMAIILFVSIKLALILLCVAFMAGGVMLGQKISFRKQIISFSSKGAIRRIRGQKIVRGAKTRATTTVMAGVFLAMIIFAINIDMLKGLSLVEIAAVAFCTRFFVSFFAMFYSNINAILDSSILVDEYLDLNNR